MIETAPPGKNETVLAIDDDPDCLELLKRSLTRVGVNVATARGGADGLRLARELRPFAIFLDMVMPDLDGWTVLARLKADPELSGIPVVILTMLDERKKGLAQGVADYLLKPVDRPRLTALIQRLRRQPGPAPQPPQAPKPSSAPAEEATPSRPPHTTPTGQGPRPVLIVEDDAANREILARLLRKQGVAVTEADNGRLALQRVVEQPPSLIVLDLMMPVMDGLTFVQELRKRPEHRDIPVVVLTAKDLTADERARLGDTVCRVLQKGACRRDVLLREIGDRCAGPPSAAAPAP